MLEAGLQLVHEVDGLHVGLLVLEGLDVGEDLGLDEVEQTPELLGVVLDRRAGEQDDARGRQLLEHVDDARVAVFEAVRLVDDQVVEGDVLERVLEVGLEDLEGGDDDVRLEEFGLEAEAALGHDVGLVELGVDDHVAAGLSLVVVLDDAVHAGPLVDGLLPVVDRRERRDDELGALDLHGHHQVVHERDGLRRLAEPHFVGQDHVAPQVPVVDQPVQALQLLLAERQVVPLLRRLLLLDQLVFRLRLRQQRLQLRECRLVDELPVAQRPLSRRQLLSTLGHDFGPYFSARQIQIPRRIVDTPVTPLVVIDFLLTIENVFGLPCCIILRQIPPLDHKDPVSLGMQVDICDFIVHQVLQLVARV